MSGLILLWKLLSSGVLRAVQAFMALPTKVKLIVIACVLAVIAVLYWNHHERAVGRAQNAAQVKILADKVTALATQLHDAQDANAACNDATNWLQAAVSQCEEGRRVDAQRTAAAAQAYDARIADLQKQSGTRHAQTQALNAGECKAWAQLPACGVRVR